MNTDCRHNPLTFLQATAWDIPYTATYITKVLYKFVSSNFCEDLDIRLNMEVLQAMGLHLTETKSWH